MLFEDDVDEVEDEDELADDDELTSGGGFVDFPFDDEITFVDELPASLSWEDDEVKGIGVFRTSFGEVCGLWIFSPRVNVKLLLKAWIDDSARLKSLS